MSAEQEKFENNNVEEELESEEEGSEDEVETEEEKQKRLAVEREQEQKLLQLKGARLSKEEKQRILNQQRIKKVTNCDAHQRLCHYNLHWIIGGGDPFVF
eukprot:GEZU01006496.1.p1 GENE.GEZU01006496.1~~GEZU01006496.1.p1  ORF type:complete len:100 (-),score=26.18 GEZU01006496.1:403-702(-)